jgi:hypothetical protein
MDFVSVMDLGFGDRLTDTAYLKAGVDLGAAGIILLLYATQNGDQSISINISVISTTKAPCPKPEVSMYCER